MSWKATRRNNNSARLGADMEVLSTPFHAKAFFGQETKVNDEQRAGGSMALSDEFLFIHGVRAQIVFFNDLF